MEEGEETGDGGVMSASTVKTFATDFSACTNVSFNKLTQRFSANNAQHREMLAILAAITQVIKSRSGGDGEEETSTEYFAALLTTLESSESQETTSGVVTLISMVIRSVPIPVLQAQFDPVSKLLMECLARNTSQESQSEANVGMTRALLGCLSVLLRAQTLETCQESSSLRVLDSILAFGLHSKPKVRKAAQHAITAILKASRFMESESFKGVHPGSGNVAKYCVSSLEANVGSNVNALLHTMSLLKDVISVFPKSQVKTCCEMVLKVMASGEPRALSCGFQVLYGLFAGRPSAKYSLPSDLNAQIASALYDYLPSLNDAQPMVAWLTVQQEAHVNLCTNNVKLCIINLPKLFTAAIRCWTSDKPTVSTAATTAMKALCNECIKPNVGELFSPSDENNEVMSAVNQGFSVIEEGLNYQYNTVWPQVFHLMTAFVDAAGKECQTAVGKCLTSLADLRGSVNFSLENELDQVVGRAIRRMGPEAVLSYVPLQITGRSDESLEFPRSWLLPIMRENIQSTQLASFKTYFLPLAAACKARSNQAKKEDNMAVAKPYDVLVSQIWALLPGFCNNPTDLTESFKGMAKTLGETMQNMKELRVYILSSLRQLISKSRGKPEKEAELARYAKNFLPIFFNIYTTQPVGSEETGQRCSVYETMKQYFTLAPPQLMHEMFDRAFDKYQDGGEEAFLRDSCLDILQAMLTYQDEPRVEKLFNVCTGHLAATASESAQGAKADMKQQKRSYRVLEELFSSPNEACQNFMARNIKSIQDTFLQALSKASPSSQAYRLKCLIHIVRNLREDQSDFVHAVVPEAVLCIKATNEKARNSSYTLLVVIGEALQRWSSSSGEDSSTNDLDSVLKNYMQVILAGLAGNPTVINCTILAITRIFYEFRDIFPDDLMEMVVTNVCLLLTSQSREVVGASLSFLHVFVTTNDVLKSAPHVEGIVKSLLKMPDDCMRHFRLKTRYLMDRLVRKFGYDLVSAIVPKDNVQMHKRLKNIKKVQVKKKKDQDARAAAAAGDEDDDSDDMADEKFKVKSRPKSIGEILADSDDDGDMDMAGGDENNPGDANSRRTVKRMKKAQSFIATNGVGEEGTGGGIVDFLDASASQKIMSAPPTKGTHISMSNTQQKKSKKKSSEFPIGPDGRMIIKDLDDGDDDDEDEEDGEEGGNYNMMDSDSDDGNGEKSQNTFEKLVSTRKRKAGSSVVSGRSGLAPSAATSGPSAMKYRAGGSGIHRPLNPAERTDYGSEYRAKKGRGDVKVKGRPDPHAYVPLQKSSLNKRKKAKFEGQFKSLVKATKRGAAKAGKSKGGSNKLAGKLKKMSMK